MYFQRLRKEVRVWHQLRHKNIVQMYGTVGALSLFLGTRKPTILR